MIITAAKLAPFVIPITSGEASGFLITLYHRARNS